MLGGWSEEFLAAAFNRTPAIAKRTQPPPVVTGTKKQRKASKDKEMKFKNKEQAAELMQAKHQLHVTELRARVQSGISIEASELDSLKKKALAL